MQPRADGKSPADAWRHASAKGRHDPGMRLESGEDAQCRLALGLIRRRISKGRLVLLNRETVLTEIAPPAHGFRLLPETNVATNTAITFRVSASRPIGDFNPAKPYQTGL